MRKTSQDGGDSTSITSGFENEMKKSGAIIKSKRNSLKRKVQNFSNDNDDAVIEPLLQKDKEKPETSMQSAKYNNLLSKSKTDGSGEKGTDREKLIIEGETHKPTLSTALISTQANMSSAIETLVQKPMTSNQPMHNHMHTNVFTTHDSLKSFVTTKSQILVEIDGTKQAGYNPSPLIFTTAKIHTDGKTKQMEPVHVTPVPILSTTEIGSSKIGFNSTNKTITEVAPNGTDMVLGLDKSQKEMSTAISQSYNSETSKGPSALYSPSNKTSAVSVTSKKENTVISGYSKSSEIPISSNPAISTVSAIPCKVSNNSSIISTTKGLVTPVQIVKTVPTSLSKATIKDDLSKRKEVIATTVPDTVSKKGLIEIKEPVQKGESSKTEIKDKGSKNANGSVGNKQLQRQKISITTDSETAQLNAVDGSLKNTTSSVNTIPNNNTQLKSISPDAYSTNDTPKLSKSQIIPAKDTAKVPTSERTVNTSNSNKAGISVATTSQAKTVAAPLSTISSKIPSTVALSDTTKALPSAVKTSTSVTSNVSSKLPVSTAKTSELTTSKVTKPIVSSGTCESSASTTLPVTSTVKSTTSKIAQQSAPSKATVNVQIGGKGLDKNTSSTPASTTAISKPTPSVSSAASVSAVKPLSQKSDPKPSDGSSKDNKTTKKA